MTAMLLTSLALWTTLLLLATPVAPQPPPPVALAATSPDGLSSADFKLRITHEGVLTPDRDLLREGDTLRYVRRKILVIDAELVGRERCIEIELSKPFLEGDFDSGKKVQ